MAEQAGVQEVELGALDEPLAEVPEVRAEQRDQEAGLQHGEPALGGAVAYAAVGGQRREVQELSVAPGGEAQEPAEGLQVAHLEDAAHVPLEVRSSGSSSDAYWWPANSDRTSVVLPDWRGPVSVTTENCPAAKRIFSARARLIIKNPLCAD